MGRAEATFLTDAAIVGPGEVDFVVPHPCRRGTGPVPGPDEDAGPTHGAAQAASSASKMRLAPGRSPGEGA